MKIKILFYDDEQVERDYFPNIFKRAWQKSYDEDVEIELVATPDEAIERLEARGHQFQLAVIDLLMLEKPGDSISDQPAKGLLIADKARELDLNIGLLALTNAQTDIKERNFEQEWREAAKREQPGKYKTFGQDFLDKQRFRKTPLMSYEALADTMARVMEDAGVIHSIEIGQKILFIEEQLSSEGTALKKTLDDKIGNLEKIATLSPSEWLGSSPGPELEALFHDYSMAFLVLSGVPSPGMLIALGWCMAHFSSEHLFIVSEHALDDDHYLKGYPVHVLPQDPEDYAAFVDTLLDEVLN
jgi:hypothetical protein